MALVDGFLYDQEIYHCAYLEDHYTKAKVSIFSTGKMICVGAKSFDDAKHDLTYTARRLYKLGLIRRTKVTPRLQNIVATAELGNTVDIETLTKKLPNVIYEPEQFPGAIYYAKELEGASILIFANGKVVFAGLRNHEMLEAGKRVLAELAQLIR